MIDSAQMYGNERQVGAAIKAFLAQNPDIKRDDIFYTTKLASNNGYNAVKKLIEAHYKSGIVGN